MAVPPSAWQPQCHRSGRPLHARAPRAGRMTCSGRSPGSRVLARLRLPKLCSCKAQWHVGDGLTADSCGGSSRFDLPSGQRQVAPDSLLAGQRDRHTW